MTLFDTPVLILLERSLDAAAVRQQLIASNLANLDTPGYHSRDIDFTAELRQALLDPAHRLNVHVLQVPGLLERPDGNNVSIDREMLLLGQTQLQFRLAVELWRTQMHELATVVSGGSA
jgi:flagellar basal-body rod protein FlgB